MGAPVDYRPIRFYHVVLLLLTFACSLAIGAWTPYREAGTILLFLPLLLAYAVLRPAWMLGFGVATAVVRLVLEVLVAEPAGADLPVGRVFAEAVFPMFLYVALGLAFYYSRARQTRMARRLAEMESARSLALLSRSLAHDFRNSLTVIMGTAHLLQDREDVAGETAEYAQSIIDAGETAQRIVERMADYSRLSAPKMHGRDLRDVVSDCIRAVERVAPQNVEVSCRHDDTPLPVRVDAGLLDRVLLNLCKNAWEAMPAGGRIAVTTTRREEDGRSWACVSVADTGPGVPPEAAGRVFEPFYTTRPEAASTGLGLSNVRSIAAAHEGTVTFRNREEGGAEFTVRLPLAGAEEPAQSPRSPQSRPTRADPTAT
jgi:signal transduction histidine kinase